MVWLPSARAMPAAVVSCTDRLSGSLAGACPAMPYWRLFVLTAKVTGMPCSAACWRALRSRAVTSCTVCR